MVTNALITKRVNKQKLRLETGANVPSKQNKIESNSEGDIQTKTLKEAQSS